MERLYDEELDEETILDTLESIESAIEIKAENYAKIIREFEGNINALKDEENRLKVKRQRLERSIDWLKSNLFQSMKLTGKTKFKTDLFSFNIAKNGGKAPVVITATRTEEIPTEFVVAKVEPNKDAIREALENGQMLDFAHLGERGESLRIK
jgi:hypothetical protein